MAPARRTNSRTRSGGSTPRARPARQSRACGAGGWVGAGTADLPLAVWPCAQRTGQWQRHGRYTPESTRHPAKMLPEIARRAIDFYSEPGQTVLDPMCGIATTLVEAIHQDRRALGLELDQRWAALATANVEHARAQGAGGHALVLKGDARRLGRGVLDQHAGKVSLILTSPPYGDATLGDPRGGKGMAVARSREGRRLTATDRAYAATRTKTCRYGDSRPCLARLRYGTLSEATAENAGQSGESYLCAMASIYGACARMLAPGGFLAVVTKNLRAQGALRNLAGDTVALCQHAGLDYWQHVIALLAGIGIREGELRARPSFWQLMHARNALAAGQHTQLVCHEDVLIFRKAEQPRKATKER